MKNEFSIKINNLILDLKNTDNIDNSVVVDIVENNILSENDIKSYILFDHSNNESYGRSIIYDNGNFKIMLMSWKSGDFTAIHNHGSTEWGCVYFFGEATHRLYSAVNDELAIIQKENFNRGQIASVCGDLTHLMGNAGSKDFTTLHIYGSNTLKKDVSKDAKVYIPEHLKIYTTMGSAYLNMKRELILTENSFENISYDVIEDYFKLVKPFYERNNNVDLIIAMDKILNQSIHSQHIS